MVLIVLVETGFGGGVLDPHPQRPKARARRGPQAGTVWHDMVGGDRAQQSLRIVHTENVPLMFRTTRDIYVNTARRGADWCGVPLAGRQRRG